MSPKQQKIQSQAGYDYLLYVPPAEQSPSPWATIIFLHGAGERGTDLDALKKLGIPLRIEQWQNFSFLAVFPQCPRGQSWSISLLNALLDEVIDNYPVDPSRIYLTGLSMGGYGTWRWATAHPERFAVIAPVCEEGEPALVKRIKHLPVWAFHGAKGGKPCIKSG
jgi:predicted peptidase